MRRVLFWIEFLGSCFGVVARAVRAERARVCEANMIERFRYDNRE